MPYWIRLAKPGIEVGAGTRVREDRVSKSGTVTLRHLTRLYHIGIGKDHVGKRVIMLIAGMDIRVLTEDGELLRRLTFDPSKDYQEPDFHRDHLKEDTQGFCLEESSTMT